MLLPVPCTLCTYEWRVRNILQPMTPWRNGSASDSRSEGCVFKSRRGQIEFLTKSNQEIDLKNWIAGLKNRIQRRLIRSKHALPILKPHTYSASRVCITSHDCITTHCIALPHIVLILFAFRHVVTSIFTHNCCKSSYGSLHITAYCMLITYNMRWYVRHSCFRYISTSITVIEVLIYLKHECRTHWDGYWANHSTGCEFMKTDQSCRKSCCQ